MINESFIAKSHSSVTPNNEICKDVRSHMKMEDEDCLELLHSFEKHNSKKKTFPKVKEWNYLGNSQHRDMAPHVDHTHVYWLKEFGVESHLIESISYQKKMQEMNWTKPEDHLNHNTGNLYHTVCSPNAPGIYGSRRLQLHQESGLPARHYKPTLRNGVISWGENFNLKLPPAIPLSSSASSSSSSIPPASTSPAHFYRETLRRVPTAVKSLFSERAHLLNLSNGTYYLDTGQPIFPIELSEGDRVLRLASAHLLVEGVPRESLFAPKRKLRPCEAQDPAAGTEPPPSTQSSTLHHLSLIEDSEEEVIDQDHVGVQGAVESDSLPAKRKRTLEAIVELEDEEEAPEGLTDSPLGEGREKESCCPKEDELHDLLGCAQVRPSLSLSLTFVRSSPAIVPSFGEHSGSPFGRSRRCHH
jgi:hypothetical protein